MIPSSSSSIFAADPFGLSDGGAKVNYGPHPDNRIISLTVSLLGGAVNAKCP
jgi:hypothetical protein